MFDCKERYEGRREFLKTVVAGVIAAEFPAAAASRAADKKDCPTCKGSGQVLGTCAVCNGSGKSGKNTCHSCGGSGERYKFCRTCDGTGKVDSAAARGGL